MVSLTSGFDLKIKQLVMKYKDIVPLSFNLLHEAWSQWASKSI